MIKIFLEVVNNALVFAVTEQDDSLRSELNSDVKSFTASNGIRICSENYIYIDGDNVLIRSHNYDSDGDVVRTYFDSRKDALRMKEKILEAFQEFKENGYFDDKKEAQKNSLNQSYYEF